MIEMVVSAILNENADNELPAGRPIVLAGELVIRSSVRLQPLKATPPSKAESKRSQNNRAVQ
jgi:hypothetical protein